MIFKEFIQEKLNAANECAKKWVNDNSESIAEIALCATALVVTGVVAASWFSKIVPSRTNLHIYVHMS